MFACQPVRPHSSNQVVHLLKPVLHENAGGNVAAEADLAENDDLLAFGNFLQELTQFINRVTGGTFNRTVLVLRQFAHV